MRRLPFTLCLGVQRRGKAIQMGVLLVIAFCCEAPPAGALSVFTDREAWNQAVQDLGAAIVTDPFDNNIAEAVTITLDSGIISTIIDPRVLNNNVTNGVYAANTRQGIPSIRWTFPSPVVAFGAYFMHATSGAALLLQGDFDGLGITTVNISALIISLGVLDSFVGIVGDATFSSITYQADDDPTIVNNSFHIDDASFAALPLAAPFVLGIEALIDGRDQLIVQDDTLQWHHFDFAAVGRHKGGNAPTIVFPFANPSEWFPEWSEPPPSEIRWEELSSVLNGFGSDLPTDGVPLVLQKVFGRGETRIVQQPSADNDFTLIIEFDDNIFPGSRYYGIVISQDSDGDGVSDDLDVCPATVIPEGVPTIRLDLDRFALVDDDGIFDTNRPIGSVPGVSFTVEETAGCSCEQIIDALSLGRRHVEFGCSMGAMEVWVELVNP